MTLINDYTTLDDKLPDEYLPLDYTGSDWHRIMYKRKPKVIDPRFATQSTFLGTLMIKMDSKVTSSVKENVGNKKKEE